MLPVPASPKRATEHSQRFPTSFPLPQGGGSQFPEPPWGAGGCRARTAVPLPGVICSKEGTHRRDRATTQQGLEIRGLPGGSGWGGVTKLHKTSRHREKATTPHLPRRTHRASQSTQGSEHPSLLARGANKSKPQEGLGGSQGAERAQLLSGAGEEPRTEGEAATGRGEHPLGPGHPSPHTLPAR